MTKLNARGKLRTPPRKTSTRKRATGWKPPAMPECLHSSVKKEYTQVCQNLHDEGLWHDDRLPLVIAYLSGAYALRELAASIAEDGVIMPDGKKNPAMAAYSTLVPVLVRSGSALGLTVVRSSPILKHEPAVSDKTSGKWAQAVKK